MRCSDGPGLWTALDIVAGRQLCWHSSGHTVLSFPGTLAGGDELSICRDRAEVTWGDGRPACGREAPADSMAAAFPVLPGFLSEHPGAVGDAAAAGGSAAAFCAIKRACCAMLRGSVGALTDAGCAGETCLGSGGTSSGGTGDRDVLVVGGSAGTSAEALAAAYSTAELVMHTRS